MSVLAFARFLHPPPALAPNRAYSVFSSKPGGGGGRYFNSTKPPKPIPGGTPKRPAPKQPDAPPPLDAAPSPAQGAPPTPGSGPANGSAGNSRLLGASPGDAPAPPSPNDGAPAPPRRPGPAHPAVSAQDFKLHQFFSLHRPLLLLAQPRAILSSAAPGADPTAAGRARAHAGEGEGAPWRLDELEAAMDADAAAARQLARALTLSRVGAATAWEDTLRRLGLDVDQDAERVGLRARWEREWEEVMMDSTKRKRRKKMKKHKLRKRRKETRAARMKIGK